MKEEISFKVADQLLKIGAIKLNLEQPFKWSSGWNSPIYCDNRLALSFPELRSYIKLNLSAVVKSEFKNVESIAGVATAGIPQGALVADELGLPFLYVRPKPKDHGMANLIEGKITKGEKVILIEDLISTGGSSIKAAEALREAGFEVVGMVAIFTYGFEIAKKNFEEANIPLVTLSDYSALISLCIQNKLFTPEEIKSLEEWRISPQTWNKI